MRVGTPGAAYGQRSDLNANRSIPVRVATDQTYGSGVALQNDQRQIPMAPSPGGPAPGGPQAAPPIPPGAFGPIDRPTERPNEPISHGAPFGPGPGPEALPSAAQMTNGNLLSSQLNAIAQRTGSPAISALASHAAQAGS